jgi:hypothetical protein
MRHISLSFLLPLTACSMISGAPSKLPGTSSTTPLAGGHDDVASKYQAAVEVPPQLKTLVSSFERMQTKLDEMEKKLASGTLTDAEVIHSSRITWLGWFGEMERGGSPRCPACKTNPEYIRMKAGAEKINQRYAALEKAVGVCAYGYRMSNGDLLAMTLDWSEDEWTAIVDKALPDGYRQKERCWKNDKEGKAGKPGGWAY